jgi:uncharacterized protein YjbI with pentapeptide repeats
MADEEQVRILKQGAGAWNAWRSQAEVTKIDLFGADLSGTDLDLGGANLMDADLRFADLSGAGLSNASLRGAQFRRATLRRVNLSEADLTEASLYLADLDQADLTRADLRESDLRDVLLSGANLSQANICYVDLHRVDLGEANFYQATLGGTGFSGTDLSRCKNLESIHHVGPSTIDIGTLQRSGHLPLVFLRGVGLPDKLIEYLPSILGEAIQHYSCFLSYSSKDDAFAHRLHADLQDKGVRCWFAPEDMKIGAPIRDTIDDAIRLRDKVLLVLSEASIASDWVEDEVDKAFEEERQRGGVVLFPVRLDDTVMATTEAWAAKLRRSRNIGNFRAWKDHDAYQAALKRVLRDLQINNASAAPA